MVKPSSTRPGRLIKQHREAIPLSQRDFAVELGLTQQTVSRWETGVLRVPVKYVDKITGVCKLTAEDRRTLLDAVASQANDETVGEYGSGREEVRERLDVIENKLDLLLRKWG